jgi:hypothetical protein
MTAKMLTVSLEEWDEKRERVRALERELAELRQKLEDARLSASDDHRNLHEAFLSSFAVTQFAVATMSPLTVRGWPYAELMKIADLLGELPGVTHLSDLAQTLRHFAQEAKRWEDARAEGREQELLAEENERGISPGALESLWGQGPIEPPAPE